eukprot:CAMPEP_0117859284 /NCGR_PEP_ID=MMETSP0950-20121206/3038_1 /TAXON_ID=44440 /ORGANISM="Chattonella subsalsa, Strain CCMP2191" /LENGTH=117 /DNA_ID=CAMNT_0005709121 /DNA_START=111 /DNA_END=461 /DNA_ORIENTATION=-
MMEINIEELEMAVLYAYKQGPENAAVKDQATRFCDSVRQSAEGWQAALALLDHSAHAEAKFFALTTIQDSLGPRPGTTSRLGLEERRVVRQAYDKLWAPGYKLRGCEANPPSCAPSW